MNTLIISSSSKEIFILITKNKKIYLKTITGKGSGSKIAPVIKKMIDELNININDFNEFAIDIGPGSFTGIRISIAFLQGLMINSNKKIKTFYSTDLINISFEKEVKKRMVLKRAREDAAYVSLYENKKRLFGPKMISAEELKKYEDYALLGDESLYFKEKYNLKNEYYEVKINYTKILELLENSNSVEIKDLKPLYLQKPIAVEVWEKKNNKKMPEKNWN
ncbi:tRNA threonylcarbamoyladenosine biosynthesis protein TsaB [Tepiditoga spiralis]|uniref:tRNA threonylcarbamoyladenosine biosynthesis protein TsaB n=1 Tax=Tepiditoga spiralis TaxID=2108365 RepID=A0A7G1G591_9BACT|nr:tRNA (adenosine(37)-N6)-threonylcarbamoyltransferase complex dimerization subunit type 1 TsaB [Tepiditoga spiralis]BBE29953.1 tRNA threonylcarbamoyladenosine biosynthesis protein TsaB [Tepiditoga spiralis]